ncbi:predicted protein [Histoplasma capsulatum var. duboisii H88]|uniref:Predicted protein n=1 Tax=Ajellomyces capsulatus (strain H88) TaxID=544711 RepID=F0USK6_AJEC8|nr:predicted protein [Histoplasma capsulatum var. duboisii H88]
MAGGANEGSSDPCQSLATQVRVATHNHPYFGPILLRIRPAPGRRNNRTTPLRCMTLLSSGAKPSCFGTTVEDSYFPPNAFYTNLVLDDDTLRFWVLAPRAVLNHLSIGQQSDQSSREAHPRLCRHLALASSTEPTQLLLGPSNELAVGPWDVPCGTREGLVVVGSTPFFSFEERPLRGVYAATMDGRNNVSVANKEWEQWTLEAMGSASTRLSGYVDLHNVAAVAVVISVDGLEMSLCLLVAGRRTMDTVSRKSKVGRKGRKHCFTEHTP